MKNNNNIIMKETKEERIRRLGNERTKKLRLLEKQAIESGNPSQEILDRVARRKELAKLRNRRYLERKRARVQEQAGTSLDQNSIASLPRKISIKRKRKVILRPRRQSHIPKDTPILTRNVKQIARIWDDLIQKLEKPKKSIRPNIPPLSRSVRQLVHNIKKGGKKYRPRMQRSIPKREKIKELQKQLFNEVNREFKKSKPIDIPKLNIPVRERVRLIDALEEMKAIVTINQTERALNGYNMNFNITIVSAKDARVQLLAVREELLLHLDSLLRQVLGPFRFLQTMHINFKKYINEREMTFKESYFNSNPQTITNRTTIPFSVDFTSDQLLTKIEAWMTEGSNWTIDLILGHHINVSKYNPLAGSSYIELPDKFKEIRKD